LEKKKQMKNKEELENNENQEKEEKSRRGFLKGVLFGAAASSVASGLLGKSNQAYATPDDTSILTEILAWLKTTWVTEVLPMIKMLKDWYDTIKGWINSWNDLSQNLIKECSLPKIREIF